MNEKFCEACGGVLEGDSETCPHCGHSLRATVPRPWILIFFVVGVVLGLVLLNLDRPQTPSWLEHQWTKGSDESAGGVVPPEETKAAPSLQKPAGRPAARQKAQKSAADPRVEPRYCDLENARAVREKARTLATVSEKGGQVSLRLGRDWEYYTAGHRRGFVEAFAEADLCLQGGRGRTIRFTYRGEEVAIVSAEGAVEMK